MRSGGFEGGAEPAGVPRVWVGRRCEDITWLSKWRSPPTAELQIHRGHMLVRTAAESGAAMQNGLGLAAEHGFFFRQAGCLEWDTRSSLEDMSWRSIVGPILQQYTESTDGSYVGKKESAFVWHYEAADPDFGSLQVRCCTAGVAPYGVPD